MRDLAEEASLLHGLSEYLGQFDTLVTYNGKTYDQPLLETRYRMARMKPPFSRMEHLDLLFGARRLWKLRFDSCRLVDLENQILGFEREGRPARRDDSRTSTSSTCGSAKPDGSSRFSITTPSIFSRSPA